MGKIVTLDPRPATLALDMEPSTLGPRPKVGLSDRKGKQNPEVADQKAVVWKGPGDRYEIIVKISYATKIDLLYISYL